MNSNNLKLAALFIVLVLLQALIFNHILFLGYATPFLYIYFLIKLPITLNRNLVIILGFLLGFVIDLFCNTPGLNAAATTFAAFLRYPIERLFFDKEMFEHLEPKLSTLGTSFIKYTIAIIIIHHATLISLEYFSYFNIQTVLLRIILSSLLTFILILAIEGYPYKKKKV
ncbi:MAG: rod shape-determining protein MreD [Dysgonomonas sp.]